MPSQLITMSLHSLQVARQSDEVGMMAMRTYFGDPIVDTLVNEMPHLEVTLAIAARQAEMLPERYVSWLRSRFEEDATEDVDDEMISQLIELIDPTHQSAERRSLNDLLDEALRQIQEDSEAFVAV